MSSYELASCGCDDATPVQWEDLPPDVLRHIVSLIGDWQTLLSLSHTCATLHAMVKAQSKPPSVWSSPPRAMDWALGSPERLFAPGPSSDMMLSVVKRDRRGPFSRFIMFADRCSFIPLAGKQLLVAYHCPGMTRIFACGVEVGHISGVTGSKYEVRMAPVRIAHQPG
jgi:hypothetical protein